VWPNGGNNEGLFGENYSQQGITKFTKQLECLALSVEIVFRIFQKDSLNESLTCGNNCLMNRRRALIGISLFTGGVFASFVGFKWLKSNASPSFDSLIKSKKLLSSLADCILPKTDSPSASECNVPEFIIKMIMESTDPRTQNNFITGLTEVEEYSLSTFNKYFSDCSKFEKKQTISYFVEKGKEQSGMLGKIQNKILGKSFFTTLKEYTVIGYFTSEQGATMALRYSLVPSKYNACLPYVAGEKSWATY
jgi:hypothetical protein